MKKMDPARMVRITTFTVEAVGRGKLLLIYGALLAGLAWGIYANIMILAIISAGVIGFETAALLVGCMAISMMVEWYDSGKVIFNDPDDLELLEKLSTKPPPEKME